MFQILQRATNGFKIRPILVSRSFSHQMIRTANYNTGPLFLRFHDFPFLGQFELVRTQPAIRSQDHRAGNCG
jgi:hypothetical protein